MAEPRSTDGSTGTAQDLSRHRSHTRARRLSLVQRGAGFVAVAGLVGGVIGMAAAPVSAAASQIAGVVAPGTPEPFEVALTSGGFKPELITVVPGQSIVIANDTGATRTITADDGLTFASGPVADGSRYVLAFPSTGVWTAVDDAATPHTATITVGSLGLTGDQFTQANSVIPDTLPPDAPVIVHPDLGILVTRNRILLSFTDTATVPQANAALAAAGLTIVGGNLDLKLMVTEVADAGTADLDYMQAALDALRAQPGVRTAAYDISIDPETALPRPSVPDPGTSVGRAPYTWEALFNEDETIRGSGSNYGLEAARFPQAWNWLDAIRQRAPGNTSTSSTIVVDSGFNTSHPDLAHAILHRLCTAELRCTENPVGLDSNNVPLSRHGNSTAGIVGAAFNRGPAGPTSQGTVGGDPLSKLHLVPYFVDEVNDSRDTVSFVSFVSVLDLILDKKNQPPFAFSNLRVINLSAGFAFYEYENGVAVFEELFGLERCGPGANDDATAPEADRVACTPNTKDLYLKEFRAAAEMVRPLADRLAVNNVLLVAAAGNDGTKFCADRPRTSITDTCIQRARIDVANISPFGYLASIWPSGSVPPWVLVEADVTTVDTMTRTVYSNVGGSISAAGTSLTPLVDANFQPTYHQISGTSMAAPFVTAAAGLLSSLTPSWTTVRRLLVERGPIDLTNSTTPRLDVYSSLLGLPSDVGIDALLDVNDLSHDGNRRVARDDRGAPTGEDRIMGNARTTASAPDGAIDMRDFRRYRDGWLDFCSGEARCPDVDQISLDGSATHPKKDMNLDGCFVLSLPSCGNLEGIFARVDFNGDGTLLDRQFPVLLDATGAPTARGAGTRMTDVDVMQTRFGQGTNPDTEGWAAADLEALMVSADVELRLDALWAGGVESAEVTVSTVTDTGPRRTFTPRGTGDVRMYTMPISPTPEVGNADLIQVRVVGQLPGDTTVTFLSPPIEVKAGQDVVVVPCANQLVVTSTPPEVTPGGTAFISATLTDCTGRPVVNSAIDFEATSGPNGTALSPVEAFTDAQGVARTTFTYPDGVNSAAQVVARAYPALDGGERLERFVDIGPASDIVIHYRFRQTILDYERTSTNDWGPGQDDCDGSIDAGVSPADCFIATQTIDTNFNIPGLANFDLALGELERTGTITPNTSGGATIDDSVRSLQRQVSNTPDAFDISGITLTTTVEEWDPAIPGNRFTKIYDSPIKVSGQPSATEFADIPALDVPTIDFAITDDAIQVNNLQAFGDNYAVIQAAFTLQRGFTILPENTNPDLPVPNLYQPLQQVVTDLALVPRSDSSSFAWDWNPAAPLEFVGNGDGTYQPVSWCGTSERVFDNAGNPGYWNDTDPAIPTTNPNDPTEIFDGPYRDPDAQRPERQAGDRAAPRHTGSATSRLEFVAVVTRAGDPAPTLTFDECTDSVPVPIVGWQPGAPVEGQTVDFFDLSSYAEGATATTWRFGDPAGSSPTPTQHRFSDNGVYNVDFTVTDAGGADHVSEPAGVVVANAPPTLTVVGFGSDGRSINVAVDDAGVVDRQQLEVKLTSPTPGWPAGGFSVYTSPPTDPITTEPVLGPWNHRVQLPTAIAPGVYFVVLTVLDKDGGKATASFSLAVPQPDTSQIGGQTPFRNAPSRSPSQELAPTSPEPAPPVRALTSAASQRVAAQAVSVLSAPPASSVPAYVIDRVAAGTGELIAVRNATLTAGAPSVAKLDLGDGRPELGLPAAGSVSIAYAAAGDWLLGVTGPLGNTTAARDVTVSGASIPAGLTYTGATTAPVGALAAVAAHATGPGAIDLPGVVVRFTLGAESVDAVSGPNGVAVALLPVAVAAGVHQLTVAALPGGAPIDVELTVTPNAVPVADAGGDYSVGAGSPLTLTGAGSDADPGESATLSYAWDLDGDGQFDDATALEPSFTAQQVETAICGGACTAGAARTVALQVTDIKGGRAVDTATVTIVRDFMITINPATATLVPNANVSFTVSVVTLNGFTGAVALTAPGLPAGITATFDPPTVTPNGTSLLNIRAGASFTPQDFGLVVRGTSGAIVREAGTDLSLEFGLIPQCFGAVTGRITDQETGTGIAGIPVFGATTNASGDYTATNLTLDTNNAPRSISISNFGAAYYTLSPAATTRIACGLTSRLDITLLRRQFGALTGTITGVDFAGLPLGPINQATFALNRRTGPDGVYSFTNLALGAGNAPTSFSFSVSATGYHTRSMSAGISAGTTTTLDVTLTRVCTGSIRVRVLDQRTGEIVPGAQVDLGAGTTGGGLTNSDGIYVLTNVGLNAPNNAPTTRSVRVRTPVGVTPSGTATRSVVVGTCGAQAPLDVAIPFPRRVEARVAVLVIDDTGAPVPNAIVRIGGTDYAGSPTGADGRTAVTHLLGLDVPPTLNTAVTAFATGWLTPPATPITLVEGQRHEVTVTLVVPRFGAIEGTVRDRATGAPLAGISVAGQTTGPDGRYRRDNLVLNGLNQPRSFGLGAFDPRTPRQYWDSQNETVTLRADEVTQVPDLLMIRVCAPATIRGRVINAITREPIEGVFVRIGTPSDLTDLDGRFVIDNVSVGTDNQNQLYTVTASKTGFLTASKDVTVGCAADITVDFGSESDGVGTISGRVTDTAGNPVGSARISTGFGGAATTNSNGEYTITNAPVGPGGVARDWEVRGLPPLGSPLESATATATVARDQTTVVDLVLGTRADDPPVAASFALTIEPVPVAVTLAGADPTGDPITFQVTGPPANGTLTGTIPNLTYTPDPGFAGVDTIEYTVSDATNTSAPGVITITVLGTNAPPVARITGDLIVDEGTRANLTGLTSSDPEGGVLTYVWDLDGDGVFDDDADANASVRLFDDEIVPVALRVTDPRGGVGTASTSVEVRNVAPTVTVEEPAVIGQSIELFGVVDDPGNDAHTGTVDFGDGAGPRPLTVGELDAATLTISHVYTSGGTFQLVIEVCDDDDGCDAVEQQVTIGGNARPVARITGNTMTAEGDTATLSAATSTDADGTITSYAWDLDGDGAYDDDLDASATISRVDDASVVVGLRVTDNVLATGTAQLTIVFDNVAPALNAIAAVEIPAGSSVDVAAAFTDPGTDSWSATIDWDGDGASDETLDLTGRSVPLRHTFAAAGTFVVGVEVCDDDGGCGERTMTVVVVGPNQPPTASIDVPAAVAEGTPAMFDGSPSSDPDGAVVAWAWDLDGDGGFDDSTETSASLPCLDDGTVGAGLQVTDDDGSTNAASASVECTNVTPTVAGIAGAALAPGESFQRSGGFTDPGADTWVATVDWGAGDGPEPLPLDAMTFGLDHAYPDAGAFTVTVVVCDDDGECGTATASVVVEVPPPTPESDLSIDKHHSGDITAGATAIYTIDVVNAGPQPAHGVVVTDQLPAGLTFVTGDGSGWTCTQPTVGTVSCSLAGGLAVGSSASLTITAAVARTTPTGADAVTNSASVSAATTDPDAGNNTDSDPATVLPAPPRSNLAAHVDLSDPAPLAGDAVTMTVEISNAGPDPSGQVSVTFQLPTGLSFVGLGGAPHGFRFARQAIAEWTCDAARGLVCTTPDLAGSSTSTFVVRLAVAHSSTGTLDALVTVAGANEDPDPTDNSVAVSLQVQQPEPMATTPPPPASTTTTTATATTTAPPTTTATTATPTAAPTTATSTTTPANQPPIVPTGRLPATGSTTGQPVRLATLLLLLGLALLAVVRVTRRDTTR
jgi:uncharacterized repeat protein (TIGR01451 family)